jgi:hypothetical protein
VTQSNAGILLETEAHLFNLQEEFSQYFPHIASNLSPLVKYPFIFDAAGVPETAQEEFIEMMPEASNLSFIHFQKLTFGFLGSRIIIHLHILF